MSRPSDLSTPCSADSATPVSGRWISAIDLRITWFDSHFFTAISASSPRKWGACQRRTPPRTHHLALWAKNRREVDDFYREFPLKDQVPENQVPVTGRPADYTPGYFAVFFNDPYAGFHSELSHTPWWPSIPHYFAWINTLKSIWVQHPQWPAPPPLDSGFPSVEVAPRAGRPVSDSDISISCRVWAAICAACFPIGYWSATQKGYKHPLRQIVSF